MLLARAFDALGGRDAEAPARFHLSLPLEIRRLVVNPRIPNEIQMEKVLQVKARSFSVSPQLKAVTVEFAENRAFASALPHVPRHEIARSLGYFKPDLHPHGSFASLKDGITLLETVVDLSSAPSGRYVLQVRRPDSEWNSYLVNLR